jgi:hypothetical protein
MQSALRLSAGADPRDDDTLSLLYLCERPLGSQSWHWVTYVEDIAKGFANEHRLAVIRKTHAYRKFGISHRHTRTIGMPSWATQPSGAGPILDSALRFAHARTMRET